MPPLPLPEGACDVAFLTEDTLLVATAAADLYAVPLDGAPPTCRAAGQQVLAPLAHALGLGPDASLRRGLQPRLAASPRSPAVLLKSHDMVILCARREALTDWRMVCGFWGLYHPTLRFGGHGQIFTATSDLGLLWPTSGGEAVVTEEIAAFVANPTEPVALAVGWDGEVAWVGPDEPWSARRRLGRIDGWPTLAGCGALILPGGELLAVGFEGGAIRRLRLPDLVEIEAVEADVYPETLAPLGDGALAWASTWGGCAIMDLRGSSVASVKVPDVESLALAEGGDVLVGWRAGAVEIQRWRVARG